MSNFETKFRNWRERMNKKSEREKHNYAFTIAVILTAVVFFFVASSWYFRISGDSFKTSVFTDIEDIYNNQERIFYQTKEELVENKNQMLEVITGSKTIIASTTSSTSY